MIPKVEMKEILRDLIDENGQTTTDEVTAALYEAGYHLHRMEVSLTLAEIVDEDKRLQIEGTRDQRIYRLTTT